MLPRFLKKPKKDYSTDTSLQLPLPVNFDVSANPPLPPNWNENMRQAFQSLASYKLVRICPLTCEFRSLAKLLDPLVVHEIEQIVNPTVWTRFVNTRTEMLKAKCNDPLVLKELGLNDEEIARKQQSLNFGRHTAIDASPFSDNFALLLHCTKDPENVEKILRDGLDERMSRGGTLGRGIYFTDKPLNSTNYDRCGGVVFICGVLLGDCLEYSSSPGRMLSSVKESEKLPAEKRYVDDNYFDSVFTTSGFHKFVVYNR